MGVLAGWAIAYWVYLLAWSPYARGADKVVAGIGLAILGYLAMAFFSTLLSDPSVRRHQRHLLAGGILVAFIAGVATPMRIRGPSEITVAHDVSIARHEEAVAELRESHDLTESKWLDDIEAAGAHGPLGSEPPMIVVVDDGKTVTVRNIAERRIQRLCITRLLPDGSGGIGMRANRSICRSLESGDSATFSAEAATPAYLHGPLEFRIGTPKEPEPTWWTDTALADYHYGVRR